MRFVLQRTDGQFVTATGSARSYTTDLMQARTWYHRLDAEAHRCPDNERVVNVEEELLRTPEPS